jgi:hypothetical protein
MSKEGKQLVNSLIKLKRYNDLVKKIATKTFNPVLKKRLTEEESRELDALRLYFAGMRVNDAGIALAERALEHIAYLEDSKPLGILDLFRGR